jgi:hypothetical protein
MFKKILLPCLATAIILPLPVSVNAAAIQNIPAIFLLKSAVANKSLSTADLNSIKKEINELIQAMNARDSKKYVSHYARKYQSQNGTYETLSKNIETGMGLMKALGIKIKPQDIKITGVSKNQATAEVIYKVDVTKDSPLADNKKKNIPAGIFLTLEKINGRWLVISDEKLIVNSSDTAASDHRPLTPITQKDRQTFSDFFKRHLDALNRKNLNDYLATLDPKAPQYSKAKQETAQLFKEFTLKYSIQSVKVISINKQQAVVEMVATVKKISGGGFQNSRMTTTNLLKKTNGKWRVYDTSINSLTNLP